MLSLLLKLHLQNVEPSRFALAHLHLVHSALQEYLTSSLHALDTSGTVIQTGTHESAAFVHSYPSGDGTGCWVWVQLVQVPD